MTGSEDSGSGSPNRQKSGKSITHSFVRFVNHTFRHVDIIWLNYEGARVKYRTLSPQQFVDVNTFAGHPWIFRDADTGDKLVVQLKEVFEPMGWCPSDGWPPQRKVVYIFIPVYSLLERCMQVVRHFVDKDSIGQLDLPPSLKQDLSNRVVVR